MTTLSHFVARFAHQVNAHCFSTYVSKSRLHGHWWQSQLRETEPALFSNFKLFELVAGLAGVVGFHGTLSAEVLRAHSAPHSKLSHVLCCFAVVG